MPQNDVAAKLREVWKIARDSVLKLATPDGATEPDLNLLRESFHDEFTDVYDEINGAAYNAGKGKESEKLAKANAKLKDLTEQLAEKDEALAEAQSKTPDLEKSKKDFERQLAKADEKHTETVAALTTKLSTMREDRDLGAFEKALVESGLKPRAAAAYRAIHAKQFTYDEDGNLVVKQAETGVPYIVAKGDAFSPLVKQLREKADPDDVKSNVDANGGGVIRRGYGNGGAAPAIGSASEQALVKKVQRDGRGFSGL